MAFFILSYFTKTNISKPESGTATRVWLELRRSSCLTRVGGVRQVIGKPQSIYRLLDKISSEVEAGATISSAFGKELKQTIIKVINPDVRCKQQRIDWYAIAIYGDGSSYYWENRGTSTFKGAKRYTWAELSNWIIGLNALTLSGWLSILYISMYLTSIL